MSPKARIGIVSVMAALGLTIVFVVAVSKGSGSGSGDLTAEEVADAVDSPALTKAAQTRVFFGHQSVGANLVAGIPSAYSAKSLAQPEIMEVPAGSDSSTLPAGGQGFFAHSFIGENGDPVGKLEEFDAMLRSGIGSQIDVAMMKFCYLDVTAGTDVDALFAQYQETFGALERDFPDVTFLYLTTPLTTAPGLKAKIKAMVGRGNTIAADNAARERLNMLMRSAYGPDRLFDLAALESTAPDDTRVKGSYDGQPYYTLYDGFAIDEGHLNPLASQLAASRLLSLMATAQA